MVKTIKTNKTRLYIRLSVTKKKALKAMKIIKEKKFITIIIKMEILKEKLLFLQ